MDDEPEPEPPKPVKKSKISNNNDDSACVESASDDNSSSINYSYESENIVEQKSNSGLGNALGSTMSLATIGSGKNYQLSS